MHGLQAPNSAVANRVEGALSEIGYYWNLQQSRIVPKVDLEYVRATTGTLQEMGGLDLVTASGTTLARARLMIGAEIGHYWIRRSKGPGFVCLRQGRRQFFAELQLGCRQSRAPDQQTNTLRVYLNYDGKFRSQLQSHQGTLGLEVKW